MKYYIIAGEASGDLHASSLMRELKVLDDDSQFRCWGGDLMQEQGGTLVKHYRDLAFMGFIEVLLNLRTILRNIKLCKQDLLKYDPDVLILVDYPGFNLRIAEFAKKRGFRVFYYISPQVWAWKRSRVHKIKQYIDRMFVILPFEKDFYAQYGYEVDFVGHPLLDVIPEIKKDADKNDFISRNGLDERKIIALLPGSRRQEISRILKVMMETVPRFNGYQFIIGAASSIPEGFYRKITGVSDVKIVFNQLHDLLLSAEAALVTSGTATLETALLGIPEVVCYKGSPVSYHIARRIVRVKYISLVNLIMDRPVVRELIQNELNVKNLADELNRLLYEGEYRERMKADFNALREKLGGAGASEKAAGLVMKYLRK